LVDPAKRVRQRALHHRAYAIGIVLQLLRDAVRAIELRDCAAERDVCQGRTIVSP
jgi:hypothetical protein